jgi:exosortase A-associated hydrolase 1
MGSVEQAVVFACGQDPLVGVLHRPDTPADTALVIVVGGPQYRAGSHRQFVQLARRLSAAGYAVLRFDVRGMGDGAGAPRSFEERSDDIGAAVNAVLRLVHSARQVVLWALCDGASAALIYYERTRDARVHGMCLANPWVRSDESLARTHVKHYYGRRLLQGEFWAKLVRGGISTKALRDFLRSAALARVATSRSVSRPFQERMARAWLEFDGPLLLLLSSDDYTAKEFVDEVRKSPAWSGALARKGLNRLDVPHADHTFSTHESREQAEANTLLWLQRTFPATMSRTTHAGDRLAQVE